MAAAGGSSSGSALVVAVTTGELSGYDGIRGGGGPSTGRNGVNYEK